MFSKIYDYDKKRKETKKALIYFWFFFIVEIFSFLHLNLNAHYGSFKYCFDIVFALNKIFSKVFVSLLNKVKENLFSLS